NLNNQNNLNNQTKTNSIKKNSKELQQWNCILTNMHDKNGNFLPVSELKLSVVNSTFVSKPSLFIAVVDKSGSMSGNPWNQVRIALIHMMSMTRLNPSIKTVIITYSSSAQILNFNTNNEQDTNRIIGGLNAGG